MLEGNTREAADLMKRCIDVTPEMAKKLIVACRKHKIDYIVAPYEADAQIGYLMKKKIGHFVITEDSDLLLFECDFVLVKLDKLGKGVLIRRSKIPDCLGPKSSNFTVEKFRRMCILSGCDYLQNLPGIGLQKAKKFFGVTMNEDMRKALPKVPSYLKMKGLKVDKDYIEGFIRAENTFKYQLVFCPIERKLVPLNPYDDSIDQNNIDYAGKKFDNELALQWALGNVDKKTMKVNDYWLPEDFYDSRNEKDDSIWSINYKPREINPLEIRYAGRIDFGELPATPLTQSNVFFSQSPFSSQKRSSNEPSPSAKRISIDSSLLDTYKESSQNDSSDGDIVKSRHFFSAEIDDGIKTKSLDELIEERDKRRKRLSFLCTLKTDSYEEDNDSCRQLKPEIPTPPSSQSSISSSQSSVASSLSSPSPQSSQSSQSLPNPIDLAEPITRITPPSEKKSDTKGTKNTTLNLMERFAFRKKL